MLINNNNSYPMSLAVWLAHNEYVGSSNPDAISATSLLKPIKEIVLLKQTEDDPQAIAQQLDLDKLVASRMGHSIHDSIQKVWSGDIRVIKKLLAELNYPQSVIDRMLINPTNDTASPEILPVYVEQRLERNLGTAVITGQPDFIAGGLLEDFKSTSVYNWIFQSNKDKYIQQASIYRWLAPGIITEDYFYINYIFTDWVKSKAIQEKDYPNSKIISQKYLFMDLSETERFIENILNDISKYENTAQEDIPACTPKELWQKDPHWKYYKDPSKTARSTKNFDNEADAYTRYIADGSVGSILHVPGEVVRCKYCSVREICEQAKGYLRQGLLVLT